MKLIYTVLFLSISVCSYGQTMKSDTTNWTAIDTFDKSYSPSPLWVEEPSWNFVSSCKSGDTVIECYSQRRVGQKSGILQQRIRTTKLVFLQPKQDLFKAIIDSLNK